MILSVTDVINEIEEISKKGYTRGFDTPFSCINDLYSVKLGNYTYIVGHEANGKTEFVLERDIWLAKKFQIRSVIFTPETGKAEDIFLEIGHKWCGKPLFGKYGLTPIERQKVLMEIAQYFFIIEVDEEISLTEIFELLEKYEIENKIIIENVTIDPFNELKFDFNGMPRDIWLEKQLASVRRFARSKNKHITIVTHPIESDRLYHKEGYLLPPTRKQYAGGQAWAKKGETMISIWRPPCDGEKFKDEHGIPYSETECHVTIQKTKPKGTGKTGKGVLYFDWQKSAYYELVGDKIFYAGEYFKKEQNTLQTQIKGIEGNNTDEYVPF